MCLEGLDFQALNEIIDFYSIDFDDFNPCIDDYIKTGITPMNGPGNNLVIKFLKYSNFTKLH